jgi:hypothetical protein
MSLPPRAGRDHLEISGRPPDRYDRLGVGLIALVLLALVIAAVVLFVL